MTEDINLDVFRAARIGIQEAIFCAGKSSAQLERALAVAVERGVSLLMTRLNVDLLEALPPGCRQDIDYDHLSRTGFFRGVFRQAVATPTIGVVTAGTSDLPVAREAVRTLLYHGEIVVEVTDVGVAGLWRLLARIEDLRSLPILLVAAGFDGALPTVMAGLLGQIIIAIPTSTGYGVARGGEAALFAMLNSCAPGLAVMNIDNGYGGACAALRAVHALRGTLNP